MTPHTIEPPATRPVLGVHDAHRTVEGAGLPVRRSIPGGKRPHLDPFLLLDHFGPVDFAPGEASGVPDHPHRGFETVTYILEGRLEHKDSQGHGAVLGPGDVQWMTAGSGIVHSEMPEAAFKETGGVLHGFQLWVNLPAADKMTRPRYQDLEASDIPVAQGDGVTVRVVAGEALGQSGAVQTRIPITYLHARLAPGGAVTLPLPAEQDAAAYVFGGRVAVGGETVTEGQLAVFGDGDRITLENNDRDDAQVLILGGTPIREPIARYGPFVMNTEAQIQEAIRDHRQGRMGRIAATA